MQILHVLAAVISTKMSGHIGSHLRWTLVLFLLAFVLAVLGGAE